MLKLGNTNRLAHASNPRSAPPYLDILTAGAVGRVGGRGGRAAASRTAALRHWRQRLAVCRHTHHLHSPSSTAARPCLLRLLLLLVLPGWRRQLFAGCVESSQACGLARGRRCSHLPHCRALPRLPPTCAPLPLRRRCRRLCSGCCRKGARRHCLLGAGICWGAGLRLPSWCPLCALWPCHSIHCYGIHCHGIHCHALLTALMPVAGLATAAVRRTVLEGWGGGKPQVSGRAGFEGGC